MKELIFRTRFRYLAILHASRWAGIASWWHRSYITRRLETERPDRGGQETESMTPKSLWSMSTFTFAVSLLALSFLLCDAGESKNTRKKKKKWFHCSTRQNCNTDHLWLLCVTMAHRWDFVKYVVFTGNPCCSEPCQNRGVCTPTGDKDSYECDCTRTGYTGPNCTTRKCGGMEHRWNFCASLFYIDIHFLVSLSTAEFLTWVKVSLKPSPNTVHYLLTHFKGFWNIINNISFLRDAIMRYVLTCKLPNSLGLWRFTKTFMLITRFFLFYFATLLFSPLAFDWQPPDFQRWLWLQKLGGLFQPFLLHAHPPPCVKRLPDAYGSSRWVLRRFWRTSFLRFFASLTSFSRPELKPKLHNVWADCDEVFYPFQVKRSFLTLRFWLRRFWWGDNSSRTPSAPAWCLHSSHNISPTSSSKAIWRKDPLSPQRKDTGYVTEREIVVTETRKFKHGCWRWVFFVSFQVDLSHIYGDTLERQHKLRLFKDGKLRYQVGEESVCLQLRRVNSPDC